MRAGRRITVWSILVVLTAIHSAVAAETLEQLIAGAKKEPEFTFIAGAQTFGGPKTLLLLEAAFNKKFGLNAKIRFSAGPEMNAMAARVITELKSGAKASTDLYHGSQSHFSLLHKEKAFDKVNYSGICGSPKKWKFFRVRACSFLLPCVASFTIPNSSQKTRCQRATKTSSTRG
jgi:hypothetical protein